MHLQIIYGMLVIGSYAVEIVKFWKLRKVDQVCLWTCDNIFILSVFY
jgi:hypothetical protein